METQERKRRRGEHQKSYVRWTIKDLSKLIELNGLDKKSYGTSNEGLDDIAKQMGRSKSSIISAYHKYIQTGRYKVLSRDLVKSPQDPTIGMAEKKPEAYIQNVKVRKARKPKVETRTETEISILWGLIKIVKG